MAQINKVDKRMAKDVYIDRFSDFERQLSEERGLGLWARELLVQCLKPLVAGLGSCIG